ncbi:hypothetical protein M2341_002206 [Sphingobium sp. B7D2B]|uniref:sugar transporter n=1 Tax=Sphingobium sp. B7D2B TaxID=2940583 RepID=UPI0022240495|nr:sugar transporter [Sphingobium sp. B7D2B]MCW2366759.1 hypothetical protein [Sphingobium sp. B7D2B]
MLFLIWSLIGIAAFIVQSTANLEELAMADPYQAEIWANMPRWAWLSYGVAVASALVGAIALLARRAAAVWFSLLALIAILIQFGYSFLGTDLLAIKGVSAALFPALIVLIALLQLGYALRLRGRGLLR